MVQSLLRERPATRVSRGEQTRDRVMDVAEASVLAKGFAATSIDEILFEADITKSGFFYHFRDKNDLALALIERFRDRDLGVFEEVFRRADELNEDPLHAYLVGLKLLAETMRTSRRGVPAVWWPPSSIRTSSSTVASAPP